MLLHSQHRPLLGFQFRWHLFSCFAILLFPLLQCGHLIYYQGFSFRYWVTQYRVWPLYSTLDQPTSRLRPVRWTLSALVMVAMNLVYSLTAYPFGKLSDSMSHSKLLQWGLLVLILADIVLALSGHWSTLLIGVALWGIHMGMTQGLLAAMVAHTAPPELRGTAFGMFNLMSGLALLLASTGAGVLWETFDAASTFYAGAIICVVTLIGMRVMPSAYRQD